MPAVRLNAGNVRTLPAIGDRVEYRDDPGAPGGVRGLVLRVSPKGSRVWLVSYSRRGKPKRFRIGSLDRLSLADARGLARRVLAQIELGADPQAEKARAASKALTVAKLVDDMIAALVARKRRPLRPSTRHEWERLARREIHDSDIGSVPAGALERGQIKAWGRAIAERSPYTAVNAFRVLRRAYSWALDEDMLPASPFVHLPAPGRDDVRVSNRVLDVDELRCLLVALDEMPGQRPAAVHLLLLTMVRLSAVVGMRHSEIDGLDGPDPRWSVSPERMKGHADQAAHIVPLTRQAVALIKRYDRGADAVFPPARPRHEDAELAESMTWSSRWIRSLRRRVDELAKVELPRWTIHNLRHTAATHLRERLGVDRDLVAMLLGHRISGGGGATAIYDRAQRLPERRRALQAWADWLDGLLASEAPKSSPRASGASSVAISGQAVGKGDAARRA